MERRLRDHWIPSRSIFARSPWTTNASSRLAAGWRRAQEAEGRAAWRVAGGQVHDGRVAALCIAHGCRELWTADRDFGRFAGLRTRNPLVVR